MTMHLADNKNQLLKKESIYFKVGKHKVHLRRFYTNPDGESVLLLHGSMEDSKIFYSKSDKGLAPFLAWAGYDVYALDQRGRGASTPAVGKGDDFGLHEAITEDIPLAAERIKELKGEYPEHWMAHSWGGVLLLAAAVRFQELKPDSMVFFSSKRNIWVKNMGRIIQIEIIWKLFFRLLVKIFGYLPHHPKIFGSADESAGFHRDTTTWIKARNWIDPKDGFDYDKAAAIADIPPTLYMTGADDVILGHPEDVLRFMKQANNPADHYLLLSRSNGFLHNYNHINIMTHPDAAQDHFQKVLIWMTDKALL